MQNAVKVFLIVVIAALWVLPAMAEQTDNVNLTSDPRYAIAEQRLNEMWLALEKEAPPELFAVYQKQQEQWVAVDRDRDSRAIAAKIASGIITYPPVEYTDESGQASLPAIYAALTFERAKMLHILLAQVRDPDMLVSLPGELKQENGVYLFHVDNWSIPFIVCPVKDAPALLDKNTLAIMTSKVDEPGARLSFILTGRLAAPYVWDAKAGLSAQWKGEGMGWRELDNWDIFDE